MLVRSHFDEARIDRYTRGMCFHLASAVSGLTGWGVVGVTDLRPGGYDTPRFGMYHAMVRLPDGLLLDAEGLVEEETMHARFEAEHRKRTETYLETRERYLENIKSGRTAYENLLCRLREPDRKMIYPSCKEWMDEIIARRNGSDRKYFGDDCYERVKADAAELVDWARHEPDVARHGDQGVGRIPIPARQMGFC